MISFFFGYVISLLSYLAYLKLGKEKQLKQTERALGPKSHQTKNGTLTSGGIVFVLTSILIFVMKFNLTNKTFFLILPFFTYFFIGLVDDLLIVIKKNNQGLNANCKLFLEIVLSFIFIFLCFKLDSNYHIIIGNLLIKNKVLIISLISFSYVGCANATNLTDGLDGLLISLTMTILLGYFIIAFKQEEHMVMSMIIIILASMMSFSFFNFHQAKLFMGDAGSLAIGALLVTLCITLDSYVYFLITSLPFIFEVMSVILQVMYFKITKGKRLFKMSPFHHHLEEKGYSENLIRIIFVLVEVLLVLVSLNIMGVFN